MPQDNRTNTAVEKVECDGQVNLPHPKVYLHFDANGVVICPYCGKKFQLDYAKTN